MDESKLLILATASSKQEYGDADISWQLLQVPEQRGECITLKGWL